MKQRYFIALLSLMLLVVYSVQAANITVQFNTRSWDKDKKEVVTTINEAECILIEGQNDEWQGLGQKGGEFYYAVKGNVKRKTLNCFGVVHLVLLDGATLTCTGGIKVLETNGCDLHIHSQSDGQSEGRITATNSYQGAAGIGSSTDMRAGNIFIHGGTINATGGEYAAGIGGGSSEEKYGVGAGRIYIYAGIVTAKGGDKRQASEVVVRGEITMMTLASCMSMAAPSKPPAAKWVPAWAVVAPGTLGIISVRELEHMVAASMFMVES